MGPMGPLGPMGSMGRHGPWALWITRGPMGSRGLLGSAWAPFGPWALLLGTRPFASRVPSLKNETLRLSNYFWILPAHAKNGPKPEIWDPQNQNNKILKIQIGSAQNVGKVWIRRKKILLAPFGAIWAHFLRVPEKSKKYQNFLYFP